MFSPWDSLPLGQYAWPDDKTVVTSADVSSSPPEEGFLDDGLTRQLAEKLLSWGNKQDLDPAVVSRGFDTRVPEQGGDGDFPMVDEGLQVSENPIYWSNWSNWNEDMANKNYRSANPRFKTEMCRNFKEKGTCLYGNLCQFAHGKQELRRDLIKHNKYKTKLCQKYWIAGYCAYGPRCNFIHQEIEKEQALRILAGVETDVRSGGSNFYKAASPLSMGCGDMRMDVGTKTCLADSAEESDSGKPGHQVQPNMLQNQLGLRPFSGRFSPLVGTNVDLIDFYSDARSELGGVSISGILAPGSSGTSAFRKPIGSERFSYRSSIWHPLRKP